MTSLVPRRECATPTPMVMMCRVVLDVGVDFIQPVHSPVEGVDSLARARAPVACAKRS